MSGGRRAHKYCSFLVFWSRKSLLSFAKMSVSRWQFLTGNVWHVAALVWHVVLLTETFVKPDLLVQIGSTASRWMSVSHPWIVAYICGVTCLTNWVLSRMSTAFIGGSEKIKILALEGAKSQKDASIYRKKSSISLPWGSTSNINKTFNKSCFVFLLYRETCRFCVIFRHFGGHGLCPLWIRLRLHSLSEADIRSSILIGAKSTQI